MSTKALREVVLQEWALMPLKDIDKHIETMSDRVEAVLKANGGHTRF